MRSVLFLLFVVYVSNVASKTAKLPPNFPRCYRDDPKLNECMVKAANDAKPFLVKGVPELNLAPITPFIIPEVKLEQGTDALNFKAVFRNMTFIGFETYNFTRFDFDPEQMKFYCEVNFGKLHVTSQYEITGKILVAPISGSGSLVMNISSSEGTLTEKSRLVERKGNTYIEPVDLDVKLKFGKITSYFDGLFDGNAELAEASNRIINENSDELTKEMTPAIEDLMKELFKDMIARSTGKVPYDVVYPLRNKS